MTTSSPVRVIREFITNLAPRAIFCSRDLLRFAKRSQLDNITSDLVANNVIVRLARGVFCRKDKSDTKLPSLKEIIEAKARAWKRRLGQAPKKLLKKLHPAEKKARKRTFLTTSATSSMQTIFGRVYYRRSRASQFEFDTSNSGRQIERFIHTLIDEIEDTFTRTALQAVISLERPFLTKHPVR